MRKKKLIEEENTWSKKKLPNTLFNKQIFFTQLLFHNNIVYNYFSPTWDNYFHWTMFSPKSFCETNNFHQQLLLTKKGSRNFLLKTFFNSDFLLLTNELSFFRNNVYKKICINHIWCFQGLIWNQENLPRYITVKVWLNLG